MAYTIKVNDKQVYDALMEYLGTLMKQAGKAKSRDVAKDAGTSAEDHAHEPTSWMGIDAFNAGYDADEPDIMDWAVKEPNPKYGP